MNLSNDQLTTMRGLLSDLENQAKTMRQWEGTGEDDGYEMMDYYEDCGRLHKLVEKLCEVVEG